MVGVEPTFMPAKRTRQLRSRAERREPSDTVPIVVVPKQTHDTIAERERIREEIHDAKAIIVKGRRK
jgi:hypothetical protein